MGGSKDSRHRPGPGQGSVVGAITSSADARNRELGNGDIRVHMSQGARLAPNWCPVYQIVLIIPNFPLWISVH